MNGQTKGVGIVNNSKEYRRISRRQFVKRSSLLVGASLVGVNSMSSAVSDESLSFMSAIELAEKVRNKQISAEELTQHYISRIERFHEQLNAVVVQDFDRALAAAKQADKQLAAGQTLGPLHGVPITIKESYDVAGLPTTWGIPEAANNVPGLDAVVVERFKQAGAVLLGKTNVPINLGDYQSYNQIYGTTNNPWDLQRTPGGSSGGSAVALAVGLTGLDSGSDIGGSIRNPAHYCGVYGHKPTLGVVPSRGHQPPGVPAGGQHPDLAVVGPMARSAQDLSFAMDLVAGADYLTSPGWELNLPKPKFASFKGLRVALWATDSMSPVATEIQQQILKLGKILESEGAIVSDVARPNFSAQLSHETYLPILGGMTGMEEAADLKYSDYLGLHGQRGFLRTQWQQFFAQWDVLLCPISATTAFLQDESEDMSARRLSVNGEERSYFEQLFWAGLATVSYLPSTVFPTGLSESGLPIGVQAMGPEFGDYGTIRFAEMVADVMGGYITPPGYA